MNRQEKILHRLILILIMIQPVIDLDYLLYDFLDQYGLPRPATIIRFLVIPALVIWSFFLKDKNKKRTFLFTAVYLVLFAGYFVLHCRQAQALYERLDLTENFQFNTWQELTYCLTLVIPYFVAYIIYNEKIDNREIRSLVLFLSGIISFPIVIGDLYVFADSTYYGMTVGNVFSWFSGIYDWYHPRTLASKFFFNEGNTIGILLFMLLPVLYYFLSTAEDKKERRKIAVLIFVQSVAMQMLATRVATYGAVMIPLLFLVLYFFDSLVLKHQKLQKNIIIVSLVSTAVFGGMLNMTPAVQNQKVDAVNDVALLHNGAAAEGMERLADGENLVRGSEEWRNFYVFMFETYGINARYIQSVPSMYYTEYYSYQHDPEFWSDVALKIPVFDRVNGRQVETIFTKYKYQNLTSKEKILGMGYSTFMNGSIVLERDFVMQIYLLGYAGELLCILPWVFVVLYGLYGFIRYHKQMFTLENMILAVSLGAGLGSAYLSGHTLDQFVTTIFMALLTAVLLNRIHSAKEQAHE